jgi:hypothetical protein
VIQESGEPFNLMQHSYWSGIESLMNYQVGFIKD